MPDRLAEVRTRIVARLRREADDCRRCALWADATRAVFGEGPTPADVMLVGEQPGDREDLTGRPFVGPAGQILDAALAEAGLDRARIYLTNAVKHFKNEPHGRQRLHAKPNTGEVEACKWWLAQELELVAPRVVVGLGATALRALTGRTVTVASLRGRFVDAGPDRVLFATVHPSYLLRLPDPDKRAAERQRFVEDLALVAARVARIPS